MPKFGEGGFGESFGKTIDKRNEKVAFNDETHSYWDINTGSPYISVTQLVGKYCQPFDEYFWSHYKGFQTFLSEDDWKEVKPLLLKTKHWNDKYLEIYDVDKALFEAKVSEIVQEYADKRNEACEHGTSVHLGKELAFYKDASKEISRYGFGGKFQCIPGHYTLDLPRGIYPEFLISYDFGDLKVSGQVDLLVIDGDEVSIGDYKTNAKLETTSYFDVRTKKHVMMQPPVNTIQDCSFGHYQLQLSLYMYLLQKNNPRYNCHRLFIVHIDRDGNETEYEMPYLKDEVERLIAHYKKHIVINNKLDKCKPIW